MARIKLSEWRKQESLEDFDDFDERLADMALDSSCPALCDEGCEVEPDGECEHGCPSVLRYVNAC